MKTPLLSSSPSFIQEEPEEPEALVTLPRNVVERATFLAWGQRHAMQAVLFTQFLLFLG